MTSLYLPKEFIIIEGEDATFAQTHTRLTSVHATSIIVLVLYCSQVQ